MGIKQFTIAAVLASGICTAQPDSTATAYYKVFDNNLAVQAFVLNTANSFTLNYTQDNTVVDLTPNAKTTLGVAVQYDIISFSLGFAPKFFKDNQDNDKESKMTSFSFNFFPKQWMQHLDLYYQKGITLESAGANVYLQNLKTIKIGGSTAYFFNKNFSFNATAFQNAKQLKSAGSFAPTLSYYYTEFNGKKQEGFGSNAYFIDVALAPAYYYNWVIAKNFMLSAGGSLGAGFTTTVDDGTTTSLLINGSLQLAPGYSGERFFCGMNIRTLFFSHQTESDVAMGDAIGYTTIFAGYRFDPPGFLEKERKKIEGKVKF
ncbi:DUF4421 family protein [Flavobacterium subsaxonicum]|uniref:DUF4421 domain-containing protein n=1 Tax=Flavobacterium subsaxonicum WB 4.1-42 = DSM 21790 TaxID=1121898 RepID=A0A0A2MJ57_9FLAO|nr:DUF4421 family protein [Flavobacterium subsaxonicum]KGO92642.1 hypothetical protein Q766_10985 [Flavobacterium subsaxonicum WB 4.1-42 = DSM 21790]